MEGGPKQNHHAGRVRLQEQRKNRDANRTPAAYKGVAPSPLTLLQHGEPIPFEKRTKKGFAIPVTVRAPKLV